MARKPRTATATATATGFADIERRFLDLNRNLRSLFTTHLYVERQFCEAVARLLLSYQNSRRFEFELEGEDAPDAFTNALIADIERYQQRIEFLQALADRIEEIDQPDA